MTIAKNHDGEKENSGSLYWQFNKCSNLEVTHTTSIQNSFSRTSWMVLPNSKEARKFNFPCAQKERAVYHYAALLTVTLTKDMNAEFINRKYKVKRKDKRLTEK